MRKSKKPSFDVGLLDIISIGALGFITTTLKADKFSISITENGSYIKINFDLPPTQEIKDFLYSCKYDWDHGNHYLAIDLPRKNNKRLLEKLEDFFFNSTAHYKLESGSFDALIKIVLGRHKQDICKCVIDFVAEEFFPNPKTRDKLVKELFLKNLKNNN